MLVAEKTGCRYDPDSVEYLLEKHYRPTGRPLRRCHPRDLLLQIRHFCTYYDLPYEMLPQHFDQVARSFFTVLRTKDSRFATPYAAQHAPPSPPEA